MFIPDEEIQPKDCFKDRAELLEVTEMWKKVLFLDGWYIKPIICAPEDFKEQGNMGETEADHVNRCCVVRIMDKKYYGDRIMKYCAEKVLVHELLHLKYALMDCKDSYEAAYLMLHEHQQLEEMAKSLIMARYHIGREYFYGAENMV